MAERPSDLVPLDEAARLVDRSVSTLRLWINRRRILTGYPEDPERLANTRLLVSRAEVLHVAGVHGAAPAPGRPPPTEERTIGELREALHRAELDRVRAELEGSRATLEAVRGTLATAEARARDLERACEELRARSQAAEAERDALREERRLPWWRRLLGTGAPASQPAIGVAPDPRDDG